MPADVRPSGAARSCRQERACAVANTVQRRPTLPRDSKATWCREHFIQGSSCCEIDYFSEGSCQGDAIYGTAKLPAETVFLEH